MYFGLVARDRSCKRFLGTNYSEGNPCELAPEKRPEVADVGDLPRAARPLAPGYFPLWVLVGVSQGLGSKQTADNAAIADTNRDTAADDKIGWRVSSALPDDGPWPSPGRPQPAHPGLE